MTIKKSHILSIGLIASLAVPFALLSATAKANTVPQQLAQAESAEPTESPEHNAPYHFTPTLRFSNGASESPFNVRSDLVNGEIYSIPFQSATTRQANLINARIGGVNGNFYTISAMGCQ